jgi:copper chaperone CopZ
MPVHKFMVEGIRNEQDVYKVRHALGETFGIQEITVDAMRGEVLISYDNTAGSLEDFREAIRSSGFAIPNEDVTITS